MKFNVPEKYADLYIKALSERKVQLENQIENFKREILEIENHISNLTSLSIFNEQHDYSEFEKKNLAYSKNWPWTRKIAYYQDFIGKLISSNEVVDYIIDNEPNLDKMKVRSSVSAALSNGTRSGKYTKFNDPTSASTYYAPSEWFDKMGQPLLEYLPQDLKKRLFER
ncbi:hypothetical protein [Fulvivirga lutea]|uniref:Uncharacterized protein n=1 Tax=Fulvivirga lutea TaxID=2810512 RepID=A0A975A1R8_9BACT|nr:hypothetical protein [Fulvivirga lutea]QSE98515.1 hypothetical protein JR347_05390 [Fulvivirga lutea]